MVVDGEEERTSEGFGVRVRCGLVEYEEGVSGRCRRREMVPSAYV